MAIKISVGMPVYNGARWVRQAIESILAQTYTDFEFIISDNASADDTEAICREYAARDERIQYRRNAENSGACENYNAVVRYASGEYFRWASSNDSCAPAFLATCAEALDSNPDVVLCYPRTLLVNDATGSREPYQDNLNLMEDDPSARVKRLLTSIQLNNAMNGLMRAHVLRQTAPLKAYRASDLNLMVELALHGKFYELPQFLYHRRVDPQTVTSLKTRAEIVEHYHPKRDNRMLFQHWKVNAGYFRAVSRAPVNMSQKLKCYAYLLKQLRWARSDLRNDILEALRMPVSNK